MPGRCSNGWDPQAWQSRTPFRVPWVRAGQTGVNAVSGDCRTFLAPVAGVMRLSPFPLRRLDAEAGASRSQLRESRRIVKSLLSYLDSHHDKFALLFDVVTIFNAKTSARLLSPFICLGFFCIF